jgi:hypothetical protein
LHLYGFKLRAADHSLTQQERCAEVIKPDDKYNDFFFVHMPRAMQRGTLKVSIKDLGSGVKGIKACQEACWEQYGTKCLYAQSNQGGDCFIGESCFGDSCGSIADVNYRGLDYNRIMCKNKEYVTEWGKWTGGGNKGPQPCSWISDANRLLWTLTKDGKRKHY